MPIHEAATDSQIGDADYSRPGFENYPGELPRRDTAFANEVGVPQWTLRDTERGAFIQNPSEVRGIDYLFGSRRERPQGAVQLPTFLIKAEQPHFSALTQGYRIGEAPPGILVEGARK
jgi:hypothetical protein